MSAVLTNPPLPPVQESPGLWSLAWRRMRQDHVGMFSLAVVVFFLLMMAASYSGLIAKDWSKEKGVSYANPSFLAGSENLEAKAMAQKDAAAKSPPVDLSDIDPLAPRYKEWEERAAKIAVTETKRAESLPFGGDKWGRDVLQKVIKGSEVSIFVGLAPQLRLYRSFFLDEINQDYVRTARAKGVPEKAVMMKHVLRNALIPILTNIAIYLPGVFVGSFLLEVFFSIPGLGREIVTAVNRSDFPVIKAVTVYLAILTMIINLLVDVMYKFVDPRVSFK